MTQVHESPKLRSHSCKAQANLKMPDMPLRVVTPSSIHSRRPDAGRHADDAVLRQLQLGGRVKAKHTVALQHDRDAFEKSVLYLHSLCAGGKD